MSLKGTNNTSSDGARIPSVPERLDKYVKDGTISSDVYNKSMTEYRKNKDKKDRETSRKIKDVLCGIAAFLVLFGSMMSILGEIVVKYGKGPAVVYFFLWIWSFDYAFNKDSKSKTISKLRVENELLKERIEIYKEGNKNLEFDKEAHYEEKT